MTASSDLRAEVLERMASLGRGRRLTASHVAHHGEDRSQGAVWAALDELYAAKVVEQPREGVFVLPELTERGEQLGIGDVADG